MGAPQRPTDRPSRKALGTRPIVAASRTVRITLPPELEVEPFPRHAGPELSFELVTESNGYQYLELHPDPDDLDGEPAHERAVAGRR